MHETIKKMRMDTEGARKFFAKCLAYTLGPVELKGFIEAGDVKILDVRERDEYDKAHIPTAVSIPKKELDNNLDKLSKDETTIVYSYDSQCHLAADACFSLADNGYPCMLLEGGFKTWVDEKRFATVSEN